MLRARWWIGLAAYVCWAQAANAAVSDPAFTQTGIATKLGPLTSMAWAPDGTPRLFLTRQTGEILIVENGSLLASPFATVSPVLARGELGLLGIAFDPDFIDNGFVYVFASVSASEQQILRLKADGDVGAEQTVLISGLPTRGINHNGGALAFGPDGKLYWAIGDNGAQVGAGSDLLSLSSKVGRANPDGSAPTDNPFFDGDGPNNDFIWARGFRNPFTMTFEPATGRMWLNVVGTYFEQVFTPRGGDNGGWASFESDQPAGYLPPAISYKTGAVDTHTIPASGTVRLGGTATVYTTDAHRFRPGAKVSVAGVTDTSFNGNFFVSEVLAPNQFSFKQAGPDAVSGNGTASVPLIGNCVTGGTFWDSSSVPLAYQGNFFFGDYGSGRLLRAQLDAGGGVASVDEWGNGVPKVVDMDVGPDGDLYYATVAGALFRASYGASTQALVVSRKNIRMQEGGAAAFDVRLALPPATTRGVVISKTGDVDVTLTGATGLVFTSENWAVPQRVLLASASDVDSVDDVARVRVASNGLGYEDISVRVTDDEPSSFVVSPDVLTIDEGLEGQLSISLTEPPPGPLTVTVTIVGDDPDVTVSGGAELSFLPQTWNTPQTVTIATAQDVDGVDDSVKVRVSAKGPQLARDVPVTVIDDDEPILGAGGVASGGGPEVAQGGQPQAGQPQGGTSSEIGTAGQATDAGQGGRGTDAASAGQNEGGVPGALAMRPTSDSGCGCTLPGAATHMFGSWQLAALALGMALRRRRRFHG